MGFNIARDYVDREEERARFHAMRTGKTEERILVILVPGEKGKSCLLSRLRYECEKEAPATPLVLLNFDRAQSTLSDEFRIAQEIRRCFGDDYVPHVSECLDEIAHPAAPVHIQTGDGTGNVDYGRRGNFTEAGFSDTAGRDNISVSFSAASGPTPEQREAQKERLGRALRDDLSELGTANARTVILIDTFEQVYPDIKLRAWLERWLFEPLCREVQNVMLVIAGRPDHPEYPALRPYFEHPHRWGHLVSTIERLAPFNHDEVLTFFHGQGISIPKVERSIINIACENPARMWLLVDWLKQRSAA
ncbi:MAG: hypothetical protein ACP5J4_21705 [Anaerolineae bacterium]